jgi:hypothetical protein
MKNNRRENDLKRAMLFVEQAEDRVARQHKIVADLEQKGKPTDSAKQLLNTMELTLIAMRNHLATLLSLRQ